MDITEYFEPAEVNMPPRPGNLPETRLGDVIKRFERGKEPPDISGTDLAILGVQEDRNAFNNKGCAQAPQTIRNKLYALCQGDYEVKMTDLGNMKPGNTANDTYFALSNVLTHLLENNVLPIIIGGSQDLTLAQYQAYARLGRIINITAVDYGFDLGNAEEHFDSRSYLSKIILDQPNYLFNYVNMGYQSYFTDNQASQLMERLYFDTFRLGSIRENLQEAEPMVRNTDLFTLDISAVRQSDAPGNGNASPNGFYGEEICKICQYAGISDKVTSAGFYEVNPEKDHHQQTAHLTAQMIWYFIDGYYNRKDDNPARDQNKYKRYIVQMDMYGREIQFYQSKKSGRWWMLMPNTPISNAGIKRNIWIPCSYEDYKTAANNQEIPDKWWKAHQKLSV